MKQFFSRKRVLVTGASGFIGSKLCESLCAYGAEVHGIHIHELKPYHNKQIKWWQCDLKDPDSIHKIMENIKPDLIFHLASHVEGSRSIELILPTLHNNLMSTVNILTAATKIGCQRVIISGSMEESTSINTNNIPSSPYAAAKYSSSIYAKMFHELYKTPVAVARLFMVYGPGQRDLKKLIPYTIVSHLKNQNPNYTSGARLVDWIFIDDVINGLLSMAYHPQIEGQTIDIGSGMTLSVKNIVLLLLKTLNSKLSPNFGNLADRACEYTQIANTEETFNKLNWEPTTDLKQGLTATADWYKQEYSSLK
ncbi:Nucleoside-diphosphate-sugar epimerase [Mariniphaga anaerophila]|uniref:Nucleoside-diphosphate-sugar epimerase n=1 Tax=Mariniphaga anaerophila TaxID=1484053 RepID=A0A1M5BLP6_9BACT|nr:NAD(P)-dependent oxidoreductase [Mariniphaga anaerophila]SHF43137.1 Nucleoside-diphosphate-sugar epimerase [Mariniphaga anaerophila]